MSKKDLVSVVYSGGRYLARILAEKGKVQLFKPGGGKKPFKTVSMEDVEVTARNGF